LLKKLNKNGKINLSVENIEKDKIKQWNHFNLKANKLKYSTTKK